MNKLIFLLLFICLISCKNQQSAKVLQPKLSVEETKTEINTALDAFDRAYAENNDAAFQSFLHKDIIVYGTDPNEV